MTRHGVYVIRPHGLRRAWRVEVWHRGEYRGHHKYRTRHAAIRAAGIYRDVTEQKERYN